MQVRNDGRGCWIVVLCISKVWKFWCDFDDKNYDFDKVVLFVYLIWLKSIDFTGVLNNFGVINGYVFMNNFFDKYSVFGWVRCNALFSRVWGILGWNSDDFWWCEKWWNAWFFNVLSKWVSKWCLLMILGGMSRKCWFLRVLCEKNRYIVFCFWCLSF